MKKYIKETIKKLQDSDKLKIEVILKSPNDYKKNFLKVSYNKLLFLLQTRIVPSHLKNAFLRTTGMHVGRDACIPHYIKFDPYFPELIYLEQGCLVGGDSRFITHEIKQEKKNGLVVNKLILGKNIIRERTMIGGMCTMFPGSEIKKNSLLMFFSDLDGIASEGQLWGGRPAKKIQAFSAEEIEKYFSLSEGINSTGSSKEYYRNFKAQVRAFLKDPQKSYLKIQYNGKRLNAGDDWWRARNFIRIWYNGIIIEFTRLLPHSWFKTLLLRMAGVKIGKNVKLAKGVIFDHIFCDTITVEDNVHLDENVYCDGHEYTISQTVFGRTLIKKGVHIKRDSFVRIGTTIGENTIIQPNSFCQREIPANEVWGGNPAKCIKKV